MIQSSQLCILFYHCSVVQARSKKMMQDEDTVDDRSQTDGDEVQDQDEDENEDYYQGAMNIDDINAIQDHRNSDSENELTDKEHLIITSM